MIDEQPARLYSPLIIFSQSIWNEFVRIKRFTSTVSDIDTLEYGLSLGFNFVCIGVLLSPNNITPSSFILWGCKRQLRQYQD